MSSDSMSNDFAKRGNDHPDRNEPAGDTGRSDGTVAGGSAYPGHDPRIGAEANSDQNANPDKEELLVDSIDMKLPPMRSDIELIPVTHEDSELIYFHDPQGYLPGPIALDQQIAALIPMLNGQFSIRDICNDLKRYGSDVAEEELLAFVRQLDEARLLLSPWFRHCKTEIEESFEKLDVRPPVCAGTSYPAEASEIREMLDAAFSANGNPAEPASSKGADQDNGHGYPAPAGDAAGSRGVDKEDTSHIKALYAPHIDLRVGLASYVPAFRPLAGLTPRRVVLLATSHYSGSYYPLYDGKPFVATRKDFETPLGTVRADQEALRILEGHADTTGCSFVDRAHRNEHSIELHLLFLQYLWSHPFTLVPLLVGSLEEMYYLEEGDIGGKVDAMAALLAQEFRDDPDTLFVISGDLSHVGRKFGDQSPASDMFEDIRAFDRLFLDRGAAGSSDALLELMKRDLDPYRICGFPPLFTALKALYGVKGRVTSYELWDERERESAVTFGSVLFQEPPTRPQ